MKKLVFSLIGVLAIVGGAFAGISPSSDKDDFLTITEAVTRDEKKVTIKEVKIWNGKSSVIDDEYERSGKIIDLERSSCSETTGMEIVDIFTKTPSGRKVCLSLTAITKPIQEEIDKMLDGNLLNEKYKGKTIVVKGYGWDNSSSGHLLGKTPKEAKEMHMNRKDYYVSCDEFLRVFASDVKIKSSSPSKGKTSKPSKKKSSGSSKSSKTKKKTGP